MYTTELGSLITELEMKRKNDEGDGEEVEV
jgi:hypothetical protein